MIIRNLEDKISACYIDGVPQYSDFMTLEEQARANSVLNDVGVIYRFWGGYDNAERKLVALSSDESDLEYPIDILCGTWDRFGEIGHRDVLGAVMGSGIERKCIGDILFDAEKRRFFIFSAHRISAYLMQNIDQIGRCSVKWALVTDVSMIPIDAGEEKRISVCSLRIDAVLSAVFHISRQQALDMIGAKKVYVNHDLISKPTFLLQEGHSVVLRGYGKFIFIGQDGYSKKGKTYILIKQFL